MKTKIFLITVLVLVALSTWYLVIYEMFHKLGHLHALAIGCTCGLAWTYSIHYIWRLIREK